MEKYKSKQDSPALGEAARALGKSASALRRAKGQPSLAESMTIDGSNKTISATSSEKPSWNDHFYNKKTTNFALRRSQTPNREPRSLSQLRRRSGTPVPVPDKEKGNITKHAEALTSRSGNTPKTPKPATSDISKKGNQVNVFRTLEFPGRKG